MVIVQMLYETLSGKRQFRVTDKNGEPDKRPRDFFGPVYFDKNDNMYVVDYRVELEEDGKPGLVEVLMPRDAWLRRTNEQIEKLRRYGNQQLRPCG